MWLPVSDLDRRATDRRIRSHSPFNSGSVNEWLEAGPGLSISLGRVIELIRVEVVTTHHCDDLTGLGVEGDHCALDRGNLGQLDFQPAVLLVDFFDFKLRQVAVLKL